MRAGLWVVVGESKAICTIYDICGFLVWQIGSPLDLCVVTQKWQEQHLASLRKSRWNEEYSKYEI